MSRKSSRIDNAFADTGDLESHNARKRKHAEDSDGSDSSVSDEEDRRVEKKLLLDLQKWEKGWNVELTNQRKKVYKRALKAYTTGFRPSSWELTPSNTPIKKEAGSTTGSSIVVVEGKFERMNSFTFIPTARSVKEPNDPVRRSALLSSGEEDDEWVEDLANWSMENDKERQKILAFSEHILSSCAPRDVLQELFANLSNGKRKATFTSTKLEVTRTLRALARQKIGSMSAVELLKRHLRLSTDGDRRSHTAFDGEFHLICQICGLAGCQTHLMSFDKDALRQRKPFIEIPNVPKSVSSPCSSNCCYYFQRETEICEDTISARVADWKSDELRTLGVAYRCFGRDYCRISISYSNKSCADVYYMVIALTNGDCTALAMYEGALISSLTEMIKEADRLAISGRMALPPAVPKKEYSPTRKRTPTAPCSCEDHLHNPATAVCTENCSCVKTGNFCERTCACSKFCPYRYPGCDCVSGCRAKVIKVPATWDQTENRHVKGHFKLQANGKEFCRCVHEERECDPDVCRSCGADVECGAVGRKTSSLTCHNQAMQRNMKKHLCVGDSEVHGRGAFLREPAEKGELLAEYTGGVISVAESNRRDAINAASKLNYLFSLGDKYAPLVDASRKGNKTRFINHGEYPDKANCFPVVKMVSGELRVGIYAARRIEAEKELFFDYGEDFTNGRQTPDTC